MPNQPKTPGHTVRVPDEEWSPAMAKGEAEGLTTSTAVVRMLLRRYVLGPLIVASFVGSGYLASGYFQPAQARPATPTVSDPQVWKDLQQRRDERPAPTPAPEPTQDDTERSI